MKTTTRKQFLYEGLGFPVMLVNVPMILSRGEWTPNVDYNKLQKHVLLELALKKTSLTGNELKFIRKYFRKTLADFGEEFGVTHVAVIEWEKNENNSIKMNLATEKCIRLFIIDKLVVEDHEFRELFHGLNIHSLAKGQRLNASRRATSSITLQLDSVLAKAA